MTTDVMDGLAAAVANATAVVPVGSGTHSDVGGRVLDATPVRAPAGIVDVQPFDMTVSVRVGSSFAELDATLAEHGQECPLDPSDPSATIGGIVATGFSGLRRLGHGPLRDHLLEVVFVIAAGTVVRGGGPTVKNVTGYDVPRLFVGSLGTLGVLTQVTLRTRPRPRCSEWFQSEAPPQTLRDRLFAPTAIVSDGTRTSVLLEGHDGDLRAEASAADLAAAGAPPRPAGTHRGRISVDPTRLGELEDALARIEDVGWLAEYGVGTVHLATERVEALAEARAAATTAGGWLTREAGAPELDPFGATFPATELQRRIRHALDPTGKLSPGRVPATETR